MAEEITLEQRIKNDFDFVNSNNNKISVFIDSLNEYRSANTKIFSDLINLIMGEDSKLSTELIEKNLEIDRLKNLLAEKSKVMSIPVDNGVDWVEPS